MRKILTLQNSTCVPTSVCVCVCVRMWALNCQGKKEAETFSAPIILYQKHLIPGLGFCLSYPLVTPPAADQTPPILSPQRHSTSHFQVRVSGFHFLEAEKGQSADRIRFWEALQYLSQSAAMMQRSQLPEDVNDLPPTQTTLPIVNGLRVYVTIPSTSHCSSSVFLAHGGNSTHLSSQ